MARRDRPQPCRWCGRDVGGSGVGRRRQYCRQSCRQRAYEQRAAIAEGRLVATDPDAVVLSGEEASALSDRIYLVRCAAEDIAIALREGAGTDELLGLCHALQQAADDADRWR